MITVKKNYVVSAPVDSVFDYISNPLNDKEWQTSCQDVHLANYDPIDTGSEYQIVFRFLGQNMEFGMIVSYYAPTRRFDYETRTGPMLFRGSYTLDSCQEGTAVTWTFEANPGGFFGILPISLVRKFFNKRVEADISRLQQILGQKQRVAV